MRNPIAPLIWTLCFCVSSTLFAQTTHPESEVLEGLLAGRDQTAAVDLLQKQRGSNSASAGQDQLVRSFQTDLAAVQAWAETVSQGKTAPLSNLSSKLDRLEAATLLLKRRMDQVGERIADLDPLIRKRHDEAVATQTELFRLLSDLRQTLADPAREKDASQRDLAERLRAFSTETLTPPVLRADSLPYNRPAASQPALVTGPAVVPSYLNTAAQAGTGADLTHSADTPQTPAILAQATALDHDYVKIYQFVHQQIQTQYYAGAMKGAEATLRARAGNDVDQAALLASLLRASGVPTRFVHGVARLPIGVVGEPLGLTEPNQILRALAHAGIAHEAVVRGRDIVEVRLAHTWVSAYVPYAHYRGTAVDFSGKAWLPLDPSLKKHAYRPAGTAVSAMGLSPETFVNDYLDGVYETSPRAALRDLIETYLLGTPDKGSFGAQLAAIEPDVDALGLLPSSLPYPIEVVLSEQSTLASSQLHRLHIIAEDPDGKVVMDQTLELRNLLDRRVTLSYEPATVDDHNVLERFHARSLVPAYLVRLRPQINIDGLPAAVGSGDLGMGQSHRLKLSLEGPSGVSRAEQVLIAGSYAALGLSAQAGEPPVLNTSQPDDREQKGAQLLYNHVARYQAEWDQAEAEFAALLDLAVVRPQPALAVVFSKFEVASAGGLPMSLTFQGVSLDAPLRTAVPLSRTGKPERERGFMRLAGLQGSHLESAVFKSQWGVTSISADLGLAQAARANQPVFQATAANLNEVLGQIQHPDHVLDELRALVGRGYTVWIPGTTTRLEAWHGSVWAAFDPNTGASGYFISGGLAGGDTAEPPEQWVLDEVAELLGNPYEGEPNTDPLAVARLRRLPGSDGQTGTVGKPLEKPLTVLVTDKYGQPVSGVEVTFLIVVGGGQLDGGGTEAVAVSDGLGIATMGLTLNKKTGDNPVFGYINSGDRYPSQLGETWVRAIATGASGLVRLDLPFILYAKPDEPKTLRIPEDDRELSAAPSAWAGPIRVHVEDEHGNPIANQTVRYASGDLVNLTSCPANPSNVMFFTDDDCRVPVTPGGGCGRGSAEVTTTIFGASAHVINGDTGGVLYDIVLSSSGLSETVNSFAWGSCSRGEFIYLQSMYYTTANGKVADSAKPGQHTPLPRRANLAYGLYVMDGDTPVYNKYEFHPTEGALSFEVIGGGTTSLGAIGGGTYEGNLQVGAAAAQYPVKLHANNFFYEYRNSSHQIESSRTSFAANVAPVYAVIADIVSVAPDPLILDLEDISRVGLRVDYLVQPADYDGPILVNLYEDNQLINYRFKPRGPNLDHVLFPPGLQMDLHKSYKVEVVVNPDNEWEIKSEKFPFKVTQQIFSYVANDQIPDLSSNMPVGGGPVTNDAVGPPLSFYSDYDVPNQILCEVAGLAFATTQDAEVTLEFQKLDEEGNPDGDPLKLLDGESLAEGEHPVILPLRSRMGEGKWTYTFTGVSSIDGHVDTVTGKASISVVSHNSLPVGHPLVKGVDLHTGSFVVSRQDIQVPGPGADLEFSHTYSSQARFQPGVLGFGWSHNYLSSVTRTRCGDFVVSGAEGSGMRFVEGADGLTPLKGYHGTLRRQNDGVFEFYPPGGMKYVYVKRQPSTWWLEEIEDPNGNKTTFTYQETLYAPQLQRVTDAAGRSLDFTYAHKTFGFWTGDVLVAVSGPGGLNLTFAYDDLGNLTNAARGSAYAETYTYVEPNPIAGEHLMASYRDDISGGTRTYTYHEEEFNITFAREPFVLKTAVVESIRDIDGTTAQFTYQPGGNGGYSSATATDGRGQATTYTMNEYGAATGINGPAGSFAINWDMNKVVKTSSTDPNGNITNYTYDDEANLLTESIGGKTRTYTYYGAGSFSHPIKNRLASYTDRAGRTTSYTYDGAGNKLSEVIGSFTTTYAYDSAGNLTGKVDGAGNQSTYRHNSYGYQISEVNGAGISRSRTWDIRGRMTGETDGNGQASTYEYDERDRRISEQRPGGVRLSTSYSDSSRTKTEIDGNGHTYITQYDAHNRPLSILNPLGKSQTFTYDGNGNKTSETDFAGRVTNFTYDGGDHLILQAEPLGRTTQFGRDGLGNMTSQTTGARSISYSYDALGQRTQMTTAAGTTTYVYDGEGNKVSETDPLGRTTTTTVNELNLITSQVGPLGSGKTYAYDGAGFLIRETTLNDTDQTYFYINDGIGRRIQTTDPTGAVSTNSFDGNGKLLRSVDGRGRATRYTYDPAGNNIAITDPENHTVGFTYDKNGNRLTESLPNGNKITYTYDPLNRLVSKSDNLGPLATLVYDDVNNVLSNTDANGATTSFTYNDLNQMTATLLPEGRTQSFEYNVNGERTRETNAAGAVVTHTYDDMGRLTGSMGPEGYSVSYTYDAVGNQLTETDSMGVTTTYGYNDLNQKTSQTDPLGSQTFKYDKVGNRLEATDRLGVTEAWTYDRLNHELTYRRAGVLLRKKTYDPAGNVASETDANGNASSFEYDGTNLLIKENRPALAVTRFEYDAVGNVVKETRPGGAIWRRTYDLRSRLLSEINGANETTSYVLDGNGNQTEIAKPTGTWTLTYDQANRLTTISTPLGDTTTYSYDKRDNLLSHQLGNATTRYEYDVWRRKTAKIHPDGARIDLTYDANGNRSGYTEPNGNRASFTYDDLNRLTQESYFGPGGNVSLTYVLDANGNRTSITRTDASGTTTETQTFDAFGRKTSITDGLGKTQQFSYDPGGNRTRYLDLDNKTTTYTYDPLNRLDELSVSGMGTWDYDHLPNGKLNKLTHPNGATSEYVYDGADRVTQLINRQNGEIVSQHLYKYDAGGRRTELTETNGGAANLTTYTYDSADRLIGFSDTQGSVVYTLDGAGNRLSEERNGETKSYTYNDRHQLVAVSGPGETITFAYDTMGNQVEQTRNGVTRTFVYDSRNRLVAVNGSDLPTTTYAYNSLGLRVIKTVNGETTRYTYDQEHLVAEQDVLGNTLARFHFGADRSLGETRASTKNFFLLDVLGTPVAITRADGTVATRYTYDAWGNLLNQTGGATQPFGFTGYQKDQETGLYYARNRYYNNALGLFLREDPMEGDTKNPFSFHPYLYGNANPTLFLDPTGLGAVAAHYYIPYYVARAHGYSAQDAATYAFYAQAPDSVAHYDATALKVNSVSLYWKRAATLGLSSEIRERYNRVSERVPEVQGVLHVLNGQNAEEQTALYKEIVTKAPTLELSGLATHPFGDTFFHRKLGNEKVLYESGYGHLFDWKSPDRIVRRMHITRDYINQLGEALLNRCSLPADRCGAPLSQEDKEKIAKLADKLQEIRDRNTRTVTSRGGIKRTVVDTEKAEEEAEKELRQLTKDMFGEEPPLKPEKFHVSLSDGENEIMENLRNYLRTGSAPFDEKLVADYAEKLASNYNQLKKIKEETERRRKADKGTDTTQKEEERKEVQEDPQGTIVEEPVASNDQLTEE